MNTKDLKQIEKMYDKQGNLTELGKAVMNHKPKTRTHKSVIGQLRKKYGLKDNTPVHKGGNDEKI